MCCLCSRYDIQCEVSWKCQPSALCFNRDVLTSLSVAIKSESTKFSAALNEHSIFFQGGVKGGMPCITQVGRFDVDVGMEGSICLVRQIDRPGLIASIASIFAADKVNVSFMTVSRTGKGQEAIMAIGIDDEPTNQVSLLGLSILLHMISILTLTEHF